MQNPNELIEALVRYGLDCGLVPAEEKIYTTNMLLELFECDEYTEPETPADLALPEILNGLMDYAYANGIMKDDGITARDLFDTKIMNCLCPRPKQVIDTFNALYEKSPKEATDYFYKFSQDTNYIRRDRIAKDVKCKVDSPYG